MLTWTSYRKEGHFEPQGGVGKENRFRICSKTTTAYIKTLLSAVAMTLERQTRHPGLPGLGMHRCRVYLALILVCDRSLIKSSQNVGYMSFRESKLVEGRLRAPGKESSGVPGPSLRYLYKIVCRFFPPGVRTARARKSLVGSTWSA